MTISMRPSSLRIAAPQERRFSAPVADFFQYLVRILIRRQSRKELLELDERQLFDVGITRAEVDREIRKPFWKA